MSKMFLCLMVLVGASGCMKVNQKRESAGSNATPAAESVSILPSELSYEFLEADEPHQYHIRFKFGRAFSSAYVIKTVDNRKFPELIEVKERTWTDTQIEEGKEVTYEFGEWNNNQFEKWKEVTFRAPEDFLLDEPMNLQDEKVKSLFKEKNGVLVLERYRIFLGPQARLTLNGLNVKIIATEIRALGAVIQTFPEGAVASEGMSGRSGGRLEIIADKSFGNLTVEMRGENGGQGLAGLKPDDLLKGAKGANGVNAVLEFKNTESNEGSIFGSISVYRCKVQPTNGEKGGKGVTGYPGASGLSGGATGQLLTRIRNKDKFSLQVVQSPGLGGEGGVGGDGGQGGEGGDAGQILKPNIFSRVEDCKAAEKGASGENGEKGSSGAKGRVGDIEAVCEITLSNERKCY